MYILKACNDLSVLGTILFIKKLVKIISIVVPVLLVLLISIDLSKAIIASDDNEIKRIQKLVIKRIIEGLVVFFVPLLVEVSFSFLGDSGAKWASCYTDATDAAVDVLTQADKENLALKEKDRQALIKAAKKNQTAARKKLAKLREKAKKQAQQGAGATSGGLQVWLNALKEQYEWAKDSSYDWDGNPTIANSKYRGTCVTYVVVSMQRVKLIPEGENIIYEQNGVFHLNSFGKSHIKEHSDKLSYSYVNASPTKLYKNGKLKVGDIVTFDFSPHGHTMVFVGVNENGELLWDTGGSTKCVECRMPDYANRKASIIIRVKKV